jgi:hypothetical protein
MTYTHQCGLSDMFINSFYTSINRMVRGGDLTKAGLTIITPNF